MSKEKIGVCPICGKDVYQNEFKVYCEDSRYKDGKVQGCPFQFFRSVGPKDNRTVLTDDEIQDIIANGETSNRVTIHKKGKPDETYSCFLKFNADEHRLNYDFDRDD